MNTWYVLAKKDKRYKYDFYPILGRSYVFKCLKKAKIIKKKKEKELNITLNILKRTCKPI